MSKSNAEVLRELFEAPPHIPSIEEAKAAPFGISLHVFESLGAGGGVWCKAIGHVWFATQTERAARFPQIKADYILAYGKDCRDFRFISCALEFDEVIFVDDEVQPEIEASETAKRELPAEEQAA